MIATPKVETDDGFAEVKDFNNDESWNDQCSEKVMGIVPKIFIALLALGAFSAVLFPPLGYTWRFGDGSRWLHRLVAPVTHRGDHAPVTTPPPGTGRRQA